MIKKPDLNKLHIKSVPVKKLKRKLKGGVAAGFISAGILLPNLFGSPSELLNANEEHLQNRPAVVQVIDMDAVEEENEEELQEKARSKKGIAGKIKAWILRLPVAVRALVGLPLWAAGWLFTSLLSPLLQQLSGFLAPILIKFGILLAVLFLVIFLTAKALHPDMPAKKILKKIFRRKNLAFLIIGAAVLAVADTVLLLTLKDYEIWRRLIIFIAGLVLLLLILRPFIKKTVRNFGKD